MRNRLIGVAIVVCFSLFFYFLIYLIGVALRWW